MKHDISIHFQTKTQTVDEINLKMSNFFKSNACPFDFSELTSPRSVLHHCFLTEEELNSLNLPEEKAKTIQNTFDFLGSVSEHQVRWKGSSLYGLVWDRTLMLENLKKLNGTAVFIGEINEGVADELKRANEIGVDIILIP